MSDSEDELQKIVFAKNLNRYMSLNHKQQVDVARDLGINPTTLNMWCTAKAFPKVSKIQKLADYFRIGKSDLTEEKEESDSESESEVANILAKIALNDKRFSEIIISYSKLPKDKKDLICDFFENFIL